jgi:hypothetical protein
VIIAAAICPGAPLLVPGLAPSLAARLPGLLDSCAAAIAPLADAERVLVLCSRQLGAQPGGSSDHTVIHEPGTPVSSAPLTGTQFSAHFASWLPGAAAADGDPEGRSTAAVPGVGVVVGAALLAAAGIDVPTTAVEVGSADAPVQPVIDAGLHSPDPVGLLVIADGSAARGPDSPVGGHAAAKDLDESLARALAAGSPTALSAAITAARPLADTVRFTAAPALSALARATMATPPTRAELMFDSAPLGVGYLVASWTWR